MNFIFEGKATDYIKSYFTEDRKWAVLHRTSDKMNLLYKEGINTYYEFAEFQSLSWEDIEKYIIEHSVQ